jgi:hypothetical protein
MPSSPRLKLPSLDGVDFGNPDEMMSQYLGMYQALNSWARLIADQMNDPRYIIMPDGKSLASAEKSLERGMLVLYHGTWSSAAGFARRRQCVFADGRNGSPQIHPSPDDATTLQRYVRASCWGCNSGALSGAETHAHAVTTAPFQYCAAGCCAVTAVAAAAADIPTCTVIVLMKT